MPTCRRKRVLLTEPSPVLLDALKRDPNKDVFYLAQTGELFESYEYVHTFPLFSTFPAHIHPQGLLGAHVLLPDEAVPVRSYWKKWAQLL